MLQLNIPTITHIKIYYILYSTYITIVRLIKTMPLPPPTKKAKQAILILRRLQKYFRAVHVKITSAYRHCIEACTLFWPHRR